MLEMSLDWVTVIRRLRRFRLAPAMAASLRVLDQVPREAIGLSLSPLEKLEAAVHYLFLSRREPHEGLGHLLRLWTSPSRPRAFAAWLFPARDFLKRRYDTDYPLLYRFLRPFLLALAALRSLFV